MPGTTWEAFAQGRMLVGVDPGDGDINNAGMTVGSKMIGIAQENLPPRVMVRVSLTNATDSTVNIGAGTGFRNMRLADASFADPGNYSFGQAFDIRNPQYAAYMWRRTA